MYVSFVDILMVELAACIGCMGMGFLLDLFRKHAWGVSPRNLAHLKTRNATTPHA